MDIVTLKQSKPLQVSIFGYVFLALSPFLWYYNDTMKIEVGLIFLIGLVLIGYSITYEISKEFDTYKRFQIFGLKLWKEKLKLVFPEYISLFSAAFKKDNDWGAVAALGSQSKDQSFVIKFFKGTKSEIVYKENDYKTVFAKANELSKLLNVKIHNTIKK